MKHFLTPDLLILLLSLILLLLLLIFYLWLRFHLKRKELEEQVSHLEHSYEIQVRWCAEEEKRFLERIWKKERELEVIRERGLKPEGKRCK